MVKVLPHSLLLFLAFLSPAFAEFDLKVFKVGGGNFVVMKAPSVIEDGKVEYMVVDCGVGDYESASRVREEVGLRSKRPSYFDQTYKKDVIPKPDVSSSEIKEKVGQLKTRKRYDDFSGEDLKIKAKNLLITNKIAKLQRNALNQIKDNILDYFNPKDDEPQNRTFGKLENERTVIKTLVITHPNDDHFSWAQLVFPLERFKIENIVLGGLPERYMGSSLTGNITFKEWLVQHEDETKIYFMGLEGLDLDNFMEDKDLDEKFEALEEGKYRFAPQMFSEDLKDINNCNLVNGREEGKGKIQIDFSNVLKFGKDTKVSLLSVNPLHEEARNGIVLRHDYKDRNVDDNVDSLTIKIENTATQRSAILMGDATGITTRRIINNYLEEDWRVGKNNKLFKNGGENNQLPQDHLLRTDLLLAAHHGSGTFESNDYIWLLLTSPQFVFLSNGLQYNAFREEVYQHFRNLNSLNKQVSRHKMIVGIKKPIKGKSSKKEDTKNIKVGKTNSGIFSTLTNGDLIAKFLDKKLDNNNFLELSCSYYDQDSEKYKPIPIEFDEYPVIEEETLEPETATEEENYKGWVWENLPSTSLEKPLKITLQDLASQRSLSVESIPLIDNIVALLQKQPALQDVSEEEIKLTEIFITVEDEFKGELALTLNDQEISMPIDFTDYTMKPLVELIIKTTSAQYIELLQKVKIDGNPVPLSLRDERNNFIIEQIQNCFFNANLSISPETVKKMFMVQLNIQDLKTSLIQVNSIENYEEFNKEIIQINKELNITSNYHDIIDNIKNSLISIDLNNSENKFLLEEIIEAQFYSNALNDVQEGMIPNKPYKFEFNLNDDRNDFLLKNIYKKYNLSEDGEYEDEKTNIKNSFKCILNIIKTDNNKLEARILSLNLNTGQTEEWMINFDDIFDRSTQNIIKQLNDPLYSQELLPEGTPLQDIIQNKRKELEKYVPGRVESFLKHLKNSEYEKVSAYKASNLIAKEVTMDDVTKESTKANYIQKLMEDKDLPEKNRKQRLVDLWESLKLAFSGKLFNEWVDIQLKTLQDTPSFNKNIDYSGEIKQKLDF